MKIAYREIEVENKESAFQFHNTDPAEVVYITTTTTTTTNNNNKKKNRKKSHLCYPLEKVRAVSHQDKPLLLHGNWQPVV